WVGESAEYALRRGGVTAFDDERAVNYGLLFHGVPSFSPKNRLSLRLSIYRPREIVKWILK
ncbi:MAG: hypothetical protein JWO80_6279, partial [Bryobacterales bacterium]|nr:hypothetical protein [Bryobacterales bacterium]